MGRRQRQQRQQRRQRSGQRAKGRSMANAGRRPSSRQAGPAGADSKNPRGYLGLHSLKLAEEEGFEPSSPASFFETGGGGGIRTLVTGVTGETVFETAAFNRSATPPKGATRLAEKVAERWGFEPQIPFWGIHDFQSCSFGQLGHLSTQAYSYDFRAADKYSTLHPPLAQARISPSRETRSPAAAGAAGLPPAASRCNR